MEIRKILMLFVLILVFGCGSRKAEVDKQKVETKELRDLVLKLQNNIQSNVRLTKVANKTTIEPINKNDSSTFNGTSFKNARITIEETKSDSTANVNDKSKSEVKVKEEKESSQKSKIKNTESKKPNPWLWVFLAVVVFLVLRLKPWK